MTSIGDRAFENCCRLSQIAIPDSLRELGECAFYGCAELAELNIPEQVQKIGPKALHGTAFYDALSEDFVIFGDGILVKYAGSSPQVTVPDGVKQITDAFGDRIVTDIILSDSVERIGDCAFADCKSLESITFGSGLKTIGIEAFRSCTALREIEIPDSVTTVGRSAFWECRALESVSVGSVLTTLPADLFSCCTALRSVELPEQITEIGNGTFSVCTALEELLPRPTSKRSALMRLHPALPFHRSGCPRVCPNWNFPPLKTALL